MINVKAQPGKVCRLSDELCVTEEPQLIKKTIAVRRRLKDGSLIEVVQNQKNTGASK